MFRCIVKGLQNKTKYSLDIVTMNCLKNKRSKFKHSITVALQLTLHQVQFSSLSINIMFLLVLNHLFVQNHVIQKLPVNKNLHRTHTVAKL